MENKEVEQASDRLLNNEYDFPHDFYGEDKATTWECDVNALISYIEQLELENKMLKDKTTPKEAIWEYDEIIFWLMSKLCRTLSDNWEVSDDTKYFNCPNCDQKNNT